MTAGHKRASDSCSSAPESVNQKPEGAMYEFHESGNLGSARLCRVETGHCTYSAKKDVKSNENDCSRTGGTIILNKIEKARKSNSKTFQLCISQNYIFVQLMQILPPQ